MGPTREVRHANERSKRMRVHSELSSLLSKPSLMRQAALVSAVANGSQGLIGASDGVLVARHREIGRKRDQGSFPDDICLPAERRSSGFNHVGGAHCRFVPRAAFFVDRILKSAK